MNDIEKNQKKKKPSVSVERDPATDIRFPLMILFLLAATFSFLLELPPALTLAVGGTMAGVWAFVRERNLMIELLSNWKNHWMIIGPVIGAFVYGFVDISIQTVTSSVIDAGGLAPGKELPAIFTLLLQMRAAAGDIPPVLLGLGGAVVLGIFEELFWRGFIQTRLMLLTSHGVAVLVTALLYAVYYFFALGPLAAGLALFLGIALSLFTLRSRSLLPAILCHMTFVVLALWIRPDLSLM
ncbi:MAG: CPBP family intramembrane metalloprotease [Deltaproteobacteria bacterium]|nr:CPBP family intramembrane metalloprotease [Deltaproteobacteria bacterium]MBN2672704.1 CPBP family intramembrane metalloprotease [Deltaproteobacteria bacterium]